MEPPCLEQSILECQLLGQNCREKDPASYQAQLVDFPEAIGWPVWKEGLDGSFGCLGGYYYILVE